MTTDAALDADVVVAGGGLVGLSLACALGQSRLRVLLVDPAPADAGATDHRSVALSPSSRRILSALDIWPEVVGGAAPISTIQVSEAGGFGQLRLKAEDEGLDALGHVLMNRDLEAALRRRLARCESVRLVGGARVEAPRLTDDHVSLTLAGDHGVVRARLLLAADGAQSPLRTALDLETRDTDYGQTALVATVSAAQPHQGQAFERFTPDGPLALLPLPDGRLSMVWTVASEQAVQLAGADDPGFLQHLQKAFGYRLGKFTTVSGRASWPLRLRRAPQRRRGRAVLVGNAACNLHPVAGQGLNLALRDVAALAETLHQVGLAGQDPGDAATLDQWLRRQQADQDRVVRFTHGLVGIFCNRLPGLRAGRNLGLVGMALLPMLRRRLTRQAMGSTETEGRLVRGLPLENR